MFFWSFLKLGDNVGKVFRFIKVDLVKKGRDFVDRINFVKFDGERLLFLSG